MHWQVGHVTFIEELGQLVGRDRGWVDVGALYQAFVRQGMAAVIHYNEEEMILELGVEKQVCRPEIPCAVQQQVLLGVRSVYNEDT